MDLKSFVLEQNRDYSPKSSTATLSGFLESSIHDDFLNEISLRIEQMRDFNEDCDSKKYLETRGAIKVLRLVADIFKDLHNNSMEDNKHPNTNEEEM
jgi:hypothetical protein